MHMYIMARGLCVCVILSICVHTPLQYRRSTTSSHPAVTKCSIYDGKISLMWIDNTSVLIIRVMCIYTITVQRIW